jgi:phospholipid transport system substrate-binding protein
VAAALLTACFGFAQLAVADPADDAAAVIGRLQGALVDAAGLEPDPGFPARYDRLAPVIADTHDLATMGRLTVRRFWREWSETERATFTDAFVRLSTATYANRFAAVGSDSFAILGATEDSAERVQVQAVIRRRDADDVPLDYLLQLVDGRWRIINVFADGASELSLMASEFYAIVESAGLAALIAEIETRIDALEI